MIENRMYRAQSVLRISGKCNTRIKRNIIEREEIFQSGRLV